MYVQTSRYVGGLVIDRRIVSGVIAQSSRACRQDYIALALLVVHCKLDQHRPV